jgi:hypothetical protein
MFAIEQDHLSAGLYLICSRITRRRRSSSVRRRLCRRVCTTHFSLCLRTRGSSRIFSRLSSPVRGRCRRSARLPSSVFVKSGYSREEALSRWV